MTSTLVVGSAAVVAVRQDPQAQPAVFDAGQALRQVIVVLAWAKAERDRQRGRSLGLVRSGSMEVGHAEAWHHVRIARAEHTADRPQQG